MIKNKIKKIQTKKDKNKYSNMFVKKYTALTLIELIITMMIFSIVLSLFSALLISFIKGSYITNARAGVQSSMDQSIIVAQNYIVNADINKVWPVKDNQLLSSCQKTNNVNDPNKFSAIAFQQKESTNIFLISIETKSIKENKNYVDIGRIYLRKFEDKSKLEGFLSALPTTSSATFPTNALSYFLESRVLTYQDTNIKYSKGIKYLSLDITKLNTPNTAQSYFECNTFSRPSTGQIFVLVSLKLEAESTYKISKTQVAITGIKRYFSQQLEGTQ